MISKISILDVNQLVKTNKKKVKSTKIGRIYIPDVLNSLSDLV